MEKNLLKIKELVEKAYNQIDKALDSNNRDYLEFGVSSGLESILEIKRIIEDESIIENGVVSNFKGYIKGVEINKEWIYNSTEWVLSLLEDELNINGSIELINDYMAGLNHSYIKLEYFSLAEFEDEIYNKIQNKDFDYKESQYKYMEDFYTRLKKEYL